MANSTRGSVRRAEAAEASAAAVPNFGELTPAKQSEKERGKRDREVLYHSAELQRRSNGEEEQRGGGSAELRASPTMAAAAAMVLRGQRRRLWFDRVSRGSGVA